MKYVKVSDDTHQALKTYCVFKKQNMQEVADKVISDFLRREAGIIE